MLAVYSVGLTMALVFYSCTYVLAVRPDPYCFRYYESIVQNEFRCNTSIRFGQFFTHNCFDVCSFVCLFVVVWSLLWSHIHFSTFNPNSGKIVFEVLWRFPWIYNFHFITSLIHKEGRSFISCHQNKYCHINLTLFDCGNGQPMTDLASDTYHDSELTADTAWTARIQEVNGPETQNRTKTIGKNMST